MNDSRPASRIAWRPADILWVGVWFALVAGAVEAAVIEIRWSLLHELVWASRDVVWMAPLSYLGFFVPPAVLLWLVARWRQGLVPIPWVVGAYALVAVVPLIRFLTHQRLHIVSIVVLAAGIAVQAARLAARGKLTSVARRTTPWLALCVAIAGLGTTAWRAVAERRALAEPAGPGAPNVLFLLLDTVRAASLSLYGYGRPTSPELAQFGKRGVVFDRAMSPSSWTLQSHASFFTGRHPHELAVDFLTPLDPRTPTLAEILRQHGYRTAGFIGNLAYVGYDSGLERGFAHWEDYRRTLRQIFYSSELGQLLHEPIPKLVLRARDRKPNALVTDQFLRWLPQNSDRPFFAFLNYIEAHHPYYAPPEIRRRFASTNALADRYDASIAALDQEIGRLLAELESQGILDNTIVIVTADHGEQLGEHGLLQHDNSLYIQLLHVPLIIVYPKAVPVGKRVHAPIGLRDLPATVLTLAVGSSAPLPGTPLSRYWGAGIPAPLDDVVVADVAQRPKAPGPARNTNGPLRSLLLGDYHYIVNTDGTEELFDYARDPGEERNLAADSTQGVLATFRRLRATIWTPR